MRRATSGAAQRIAGDAGEVATSSAFLRGRLLNDIPTPARIPRVLPNSIDLRESPPPRASAPVVLFVGRIVRDKGADTFVAACARALPQLPGWSAEMIGADRFGPDSPETPFLRAAPAARADRPAWRCPATGRTPRCWPPWPAPPSWWCRAAGRSRSA